MELLYRYNVGPCRTSFSGARAGACTNKLNPADPSRLKPPSSNPCAYEVSENLVSKFAASNASCYRYTMALAESPRWVSAT
jgi:hypothetical protein